MAISFIYPGCFEDRGYDDAVGASSPSSASHGSTVDICMFGSLRTMRIYIAESKQPYAISLS